MNNVNGAASACASFDITVSGYAGSYGAAKACIEETKCPDGIREDIWNRLTAWAEKMLSEYESSVKTESIHKLLWEIGEKKYGFAVKVRDIPLHQEAVEICEALELNIYELESADLEVKISAYPYPEGYIRIGEIIPGRDKLIINGEDVSCMNRPGQD